MSWILLSVVIFFIFFVSWMEYRSQDCLGQKCINWVDGVKDSEDPKTIDKDVLIDRVTIMIQNSYVLVGWRRALLIGIICGFILWVIYIQFNTEIGVGSFFMVMIVIMITAYSVNQTDQLQKLKPKCWEIENLLYSL